MRPEDYSLPIWRRWHRESGLGSRNDYIPFRDGFREGVLWAINHPSQAATIAANNLANGGRIAYNLPKPELRVKEASRPMLVTPDGSSQPEGVL